MAVGRKTALGCAATIGTIVLGAIGSGVWEIVARPGVNRIGNFLTTLFTFGSQRLRDLPFESAALDPTPLSSLILVYLTSSIPSFLIGIVVALLLARRTVLSLRRQVEEAHSIVADTTAAAAHKDETRRTLTSRLRKWGLVSTAGLLFILVLGLTFAGIAFSVLNRSVLVWRVFHANERICAPYMTPQELSSLEAAFASMKTRNDYVRIRQKQHTVAKKYNLILITDGIQDRAPN